MWRPGKECLTATCLPIYDFVVVGMDVENYATCLTKDDTKTLAVNDSDWSLEFSFGIKLDEHDFEVVDAEPFTNEGPGFCLRIRFFGIRRQNDHDMWKTCFSYDFLHTLQGASDGKAADEEEQHRKGEVSHLAVLTRHGLFILEIPVLTVGDFTCRIRGLDIVFARASLASARSVVFSKNSIVDIAHHLLLCC